MSADQSWKLRAACRREDPDLFFAGKGQNDKVAKALAICVRCPVRAECLEAALASETARGNTPHGVAGGLTAKQRLELVQATRAERERRESPDVQRIRRMAGKGMGDPEISRATGMSVKAVQQLRNYHDIEAGAKVSRGRLVDRVRAVA